jgi:ApaG protein
MNSKISNGVKISVETHYQSEYSNPAVNEFMFAYRITIENHNEFPVRLLRRYWSIHDSIGSSKEVEGEGVVGQQPVINPSDTYSYVSGCNLKSDLGKMQGNYLLENFNNKKTFRVAIPAFILATPFKLN